jgi:hypothetical protein
MKMRLIIIKRTTGVIMEGKEKKRKKETMRIHLGFLSK